MTAEGFADLVVIEVQDRRHEGLLDDIRGPGLEAQEAAQATPDLGMYEGVVALRQLLEGVAVAALGSPDEVYGVSHGAVAPSVELRGSPVAGSTRV